MKNKIKFGDIKINDISRQHVIDCLDNNYITLGPKTKLFEKKWAEIFGYPYSVAFNSGTSGLLAACITLYDFGAKPGDGIICPALSFIATANAIRAAGFTPVFVDCKKQDLQMQEYLVENTILSYNKGHICGIVGVNLMGKPCRLDILRDIANKFNIKLIVDNCEAYGSQLHGKYALEYGDMEITSNYIAHIIQSAEMSTVSTENKKIRDILKSIRSHGREPDSLYFNHIRYGLNLKPTDLHCSIGLGQIDNFWNIFNKRKEIISKYRECMDEFKNKFYFVDEDNITCNAPHAFSLTLREKYANNNNIKYIQYALNQNEIEWKRNFQSMPSSKAFSYLNDNKIYENAEYISNYGIHIGCSDLMQDDDVKYVCNILVDISKNLD